MPSGGGVRKDTLTPNLKRLAKNYPNVLLRAHRVETEIETTEVRRRTPVDSGALVGTVHAEGPYVNMRSIYSMIVAGGPAAAYAVIVHEDPYPFHPVGQWKYIESVLMESKDYFMARVVARAQLSMAF